MFTIETSHHGKFGLRESSARKPARFPGACFFRWMAVCFEKRTLEKYFRWQNVDQNWKKYFLIESNSFLAGNAAGPPAYTAPQIPLNVPQLFLFLMSRPRIEIKAGE